MLYNGKHRCVRCSVLSSSNKEESKYCGKTSPSSVAHFLLPFLKVEPLCIIISEWQIQVKQSLQVLEFSAYKYSANYQSTYQNLVGMTSQLYFYDLSCKGMTEPSGALSLC